MRKTVAFPAGTQREDRMTLLACGGCFGGPMMTMILWAAGMAVGFLTQFLYRR